MTTDNWIHLDIAGVMTNKAEVPYLCKGMSGIDCVFWCLSKFERLPVAIINALAMLLCRDFTIFILLFAV